MWIVTGCVLSAVISVFCLIGCIWSVRNAEAALESLQAKQHFLASQCGLLQRSQNDQAEALTELANKLKMMRVRASTRASETTSDLPDPYRDPDGWRKAMTSKMAQAKVGG
jgi:biopolymer transport protein ExbB/TolQ